MDFFNERAFWSAIHSFIFNGICLLRFSIDGSMLKSNKDSSARLRPQPMNGKMYEYQISWNDNKKSSNMKRNIHLWKRYKTASFSVLLAGVQNLPRRSEHKKIKNYYLFILNQKYFSTLQPDHNSKRGGKNFSLAIILSILPY